MSQEHKRAADERKDFFISYSSADQAWAEWIAAELEQAHYTTIIQAWDFRPGSNFVAEMDQAARTAERTIAVLSPASLESHYTRMEWEAALLRHARDHQPKLLPIQVQPCNIEGLLGLVVYIDLVQQEEQVARERLLEGIRRERIRPATVPFPGSLSPQVPLDSPVFPGSLPPFWNIPYPQNQLFTGREDLLQQLVTALRAGKLTALSQPQAISGLGGVGKTQVALEYAYRYRQDYRAVLWAQADTQEALTTSFLALAALLNLPEQDVPESARVIEAVKQWLQRETSWLLILDNADDLAMVRSFLPSSQGGHLLLTTRAQAMGRLAHCLKVETLPTEQGALFLLHRAGLLAQDVSLEQASEQERKEARALCEELGGLPLALDQAGAYIEETGCNLLEYQQRYQHRRSELLAWRGGLVEDHPESVATTWSLSFRRVEQENAAAADLLRLCAFLAPDAIPIEILTKGAPFLGSELSSIASDPFLLNQAIAALRKFSLLYRDPGNMLSVHRLVQAVLRDDMENEMKQEWRRRAVQAVCASFPDIQDARCEQWLPHTLKCIERITKRKMVFSDAKNLVLQMGDYLCRRARYGEAEPQYRRCLEIWEQHLGSEHPDVATFLSSLARVYSELGRYKEAEQCYRRCLEIWEQHLGPEHPGVAGPLNNLAILCKVQGKYKEAEPLYRRCLELRLRSLEPEHPDVAQSLNNLAVFYAELGKYEGYEEVKRLGLDPHMQKKTLYEEAERLFRLSLAMREKSEHPDIAQSLSNLANLSTELGRYEEAQRLYQRCLELLEQGLGPEHPDVAYALNGRGLLFIKLGKYEDAKRAFEDSLRIWEQGLGHKHPQVAYALNNLALLANAKGDYEEAQRWYRRGLGIFKRSLGPDHLHTQTCARSYTGLLYTSQRRSGV